jgi:hypothetical protein
MESRIDNERTTSFAAKEPFIVDLHGWDAWPV